MDDDIVMDDVIKVPVHIDEIIDSRLTGNEFRLLCLLRFRGDEFIEEAKANV